MVVADYLLLTELKTVARRFLKQNLSPSNCVSLYHFVESYQFNELGEATRKFIHSIALGGGRPDRRLFEFVSSGS